MRREKDSLGEKHIPDHALYGIHALRAQENFPDATPFHIEWYQSLGITKLACYLTYKKFKEAAVKRFQQDSPIRFFTDDTMEALIEAATQVAGGNHFEHFIVPAIQGGAGTSINMNVNEIIANAALIKTGKKPGEYGHIDPIEQANVYQSTNDVIPTSLKVAAIRLLEKLEDKINALRKEIELHEKNSRDKLRIGYTQMQEAVPSSFGMLFSAYNEALSRDWWRISKCFERIKVVNLGGSAIGTGLAVPRFFIMEVVNTLQKLTNLPVNRSENLPDTTSNLDSFVEVHGIIKSHAVNLEKMANDMRLLSSDLGNKNMEIPAKQAGSSIMPGKINPVIAEFVISTAQKVYANDSLISSLAGMGCLDLNAYLPLIGHALLESLKLLIAADHTLKENLVKGLKIHYEKARDQLYRSPSITTALVPFIGYNNATKLSQLMKEESLSVFEANQKLLLMEEDKLTHILKTENLLKTGFSLNDL